jgi:hypothetical protein
MRSEPIQTGSPTRLSDADLTVEVTRLARCERDATMALITHLAEFDARKLYLGAGFSSLFTYSTEVLELSEPEAYNRIQAARTVRRFPLVLEMLGQGSLNLTTVRLLAPHLTDASCKGLLAEAAGKSKREVEKLLARHAPQPDIPCSIRKLPVPTPVLSSAAVPPIPPVACVSPAPAPRPAPRPVLTPLSADRYKVSFTATAETCEKLRLAQDLLRHSVPTGDIDAIVDRALTVLLEDLARKKFAATERPRASQSKNLGSRHTPAKVRRAAWLRDGARCAFVGKEGRRCNARAFLEFHHREPYGVGGEATRENIELRCRAHNAYEAELYYGPSKRVPSTRSGTSSVGVWRTTTRGLSS